MQIEIVLNGERRELPEGSSVAQLIAGLGLARETVAVERNACLVRRADHDVTSLSAGDRIEIVTLVGGG